MKLRWGICGAGKISNDFCHALKTLPEANHEIVAVAASSADRANTFADSFGVNTSYGTYKEIAENQEIDIVYIGVLHTGHVPLTKMMLNAGKHVLCEKPMCLNVDQVREVFKLARDKNKFFMEAVWSRTFPIYDKIKKEVQSGSVGDVQLVTVKLCKSYAEMITNINIGHGALMSIGLYTVQFANWIFGNERPETVTAVGSLNDGGADLDACVILSYKNGAKASLSYTAKCNSVNSATVSGSKGHIQIPDIFWAPEEVILPSGKISDPMEPADPSVYVYGNSLGLRNEAEHVRQCLIKGLTESPVMSEEDSLAMYSIMDQIRQQIGLDYKPETWCDDSKWV